jgi:hypothetical protein
MNADDLKKLTTESLKQLASMLDEGRSERLTSPLTTMARFHRYSLHDICLIVAQRPTGHASRAFTLGALSAASFGRAKRVSRSWHQSSPVVARMRTKKSRGPSWASVLPTCSTSSRQTAHRCRSPPTLEAIPATEQRLSKPRSFLSKE